MDVTILVLALIAGFDVNLCFDRSSLRQTSIRGARPLFRLHSAFSLVFLYRVSLVH